MMRRKVLAGVATGVLALPALMTGCASSGAAAAGSTAHGGKATGSAGRSAGPAAPPSVHVGTAQNGRSVTLAKGGTLVVSLDSTYWHIASATSSVLSLVRSEVHPMKSAIPGMGRGTVVATYRASATGRATVTATRTSCGEAMRCSADQSRFRVTVVVR